MYNYYMANERQPVSSEPCRSRLEEVIDQLPEGVRKHWRAAFITAATAATVSGLGYVFWRSRRKAEEQGREDEIDQLVAELPSPSPRLDNLGVIELAHQASQSLRQSSLKGRIATLSLIIEVCEELDTRLSRPDDLEDTLVSAAASAAQKLQEPPQR